MNTYLTVKKYFKELSRIPRIPLKEEKMRAWIIEWAHKKNWIYTVDEIGNLLVLAPGNQNKILCLQAHMDMVCVADKKYDFDTQGIKIIEKDGVIRAKNTSLGADN